MKPAHAPSTSSSSRIRPGPSGRPSALAALALTLGLGACTLVNSGSDGPAPADEAPAPPRAEAVSRSFDGQLSVQGTTLPVMLSLVIRGDEVENARLSVPELSMEALGDGRLRDGRLDLQLRYGEDRCSGDARITGDVRSGGHLFEGIMRARDCTGSEEGALVLRLRTGADSGDGTGFLLVESGRPRA